MTLFIDVPSPILFGIGVGLVWCAIGLLVDGRDE